MGCGQTPGFQGILACVQAQRALPHLSSLLVRWGKLDGGGSGETSPGVRVPPRLVCHLLTVVLDDDVGVAVRQ